MKDKGFPIPYYFPTSGMPRVFQSRYIPTTYVVSKEGKVIYKKEGIADYSSRQFENWLIEQSKR